MNRRSRRACHRHFRWADGPRSSTSIAFAINDLESPSALPNSTVRTPFTCLLDAAESVWVLGYPVTSRGHRQTGEGYHRHHECGNSYTSRRCRSFRLTALTFDLRPRFRRRGGVVALRRSRTPVTAVKFTRWPVPCVTKDPPSARARRFDRKFVRSVAPPSASSISNAPRTAGTSRPVSAIRPRW